MSWFSDILKIGSLSCFCVILNLPILNIWDELYSVVVVIVDQVVAS